MERISVHSCGVKDVWFGNLWVTSLLFADDVVLMASTCQDLQRTLEQSAAECEAAGMKVSSSKSEAIVLIVLTAHDVKMKYIRLARTMKRRVKVVVHQSKFVSWHARKTSNRKDQFENRLSEEVRLYRHLYDTTLKQHKQVK